MAPMKIANATVSAADGLKPSGDRFDDTSKMTAAMTIGTMNQSRFFLRRNSSTTFGSLSAI